ncbi:MAG: hypothetical protein JSU63_02220, partial [Phycisphaerales bacterium]
YSPLHYNENYPSIVLTGLTEFAGRECYELTLTKPIGGNEFLYIDPATYLTAGMVSTDDGPMGKVKITSVNEEYREFHGMAIATRIKQDIGGMQEQIMTISEVSIEPHAEGTFALPSRIQELLN